ncbi:MAG: carboxypeptidase regulatory-like domain-containing protein [Thermoguttaceae bacterium]|nr:carboxypeptidase regulatory-like domain-containing protein [Thermoguttaceae bacterium]
MKNFALCLVALSMLAVLPACSKTIKTEGVTGVITYNGEPLADATVKFIPVDSTGSQSYGKTNEKGEYKLQTLLGAADAGTTPGEYKVTVDCIETVETGNMIEENGEEKEETIARSLIPAKYNNAETSGLTATVAPGDNTINFDLSDE